jgi:hypothetical protein
MHTPEPILRLRSESVVLKDQDGRLTLVPEFVAITLQGDVLEGTRSRSQDEVIRKARNLGFAV